MSLVTLWRCPRCSKEKMTDDSDGLGSTTSVQCGCGAYMKAVCTDQAWTRADELDRQRDFAGIDPEDF